MGGLRAALKFMQNIHGKQGAERRLLFSKLLTRSAFRMHTYAVA